MTVTLPGWQYPVVVDIAEGSIKYDNYEGRWGNQQHLDKFLQMYAAEKTKLEANKRGYTVSEHALQDGSIRLQIVEG